MSDLLNSYQRNALTVALRAFEEQLHQFAEWMRKDEETGILYCRRLVLSEEKRASIQSQVAEAIEHIGRLTARFDLRPQEEDATAMLRAGASVCWATLCDVRADKLKRYGQIDPRLTSALDPDIEALIDLSLSLASKLANNSNDQ
ncbi:MAG: hypothetical protein JW934_02915 [Anaerolineae bacterium]|nr:hypothetical protein [Anaerolineae bacterium]